jgi:hypothetical protein
MGFTAMTIDVGIIYHERRSLQNAADAAALAGASDLPPTANAATATAKALEWATNNGYVDGVDGTTMSVQTPYDLEDRNIHVKITRDTSFVFGRVLGLDTVNVTAEATAFLPSTRGVGGFAIITLDEHDCASLDKSGINNLFVNNGGAIMVNSDCDDQVPALNKVGSGDLIADGGIWYYKHGGWSKSGSGALEPEPVPLTPRMPDPMAGWAAPDVYSTPTSPDSGGTAPSPDTKKLNSGTHTLRPGVFWGGLSITSTADVTFEEGVYIMAGGGLSVTGSGTVSGQGVFVYNTFDPENLLPSADGQCDVVNLRGGANFSFTAPTSGSFAHTLLWQDPACTDPISFEGGGGGVTGVIYAPTAGVSLSGSGSLGAIQIVAKNVNVTGSGDMTIDFVSRLDVPELPGVVRLIE